MFLKSIFHKLGIDKAISYLLIGKGISLLLQPVTLFFISKYLSSTEQGYYFAFSNIVSLSIFLELGLGTILTQFASHEFAHLSWSEGRLVGDHIALKRIFSLCKKTVKWYFVITSLFILLIIPFGIYFFKDGPSNIGYVFPWICLVFFSGINLVFYAFTSILEGCDKVSDMQLMKMLQSVLGSIGICLLLIAKTGLFASVAIAFAQFCINIIWIRAKYWNFIKELFQFNIDPEHQILWKSEILPLQWKVGLSWISGYIIFQSITPIIFKYRGAVEAGQMGMSISISNVAMMIGLAWISTKSPSYGSFIKLNKIEELKRNVKKNSTIALCVTAVVSVCVVIAVFIVKRNFPKLGNRFLPVTSLILLLIYNLSNIIITSIALYLRSFKEEPFLVISLIGALLTGIAVFLASKYANASVVCVAILLINLLFSLPYSFLILRKKSINIL